MFGDEFNRRDFKQTRKMSRNVTQGGMNFTDQSQIFDEFKDDMDTGDKELKDQLKDSKTKKGTKKSSKKKSKA